MTQRPYKISYRVAGGRRTPGGATVDSFVTASYATERTAKRGLAERRNDPRVTILGMDGPAGWWLT